MRAFLAIEIPSEIKRYLQTVISAMSSRVRGVRWVKPEGQHITLKFFGEIEEDMARRIKDVIPTLGTDYGPFAASLRGIDAFPNKRRARVVVVDLGEGAEDVKRIFNDVEQALLKLGIEPEKRAFSPHITLGRAKDPVPFLEKDIMQLQAKQFMLDRVVLFQSVLTREGALYAPVWDIKLGG